MGSMEKLLVPRPRNPALPWLLAILLSASASYLAKSVWQDYQTLQRERITVDRLRQALHKPVPQPPSLNEKEVAKRWKALRNEREFRWYPVFLGLEQASGPEVELLEFAPDKINRHFIVRGESRDMTGLLEYVKRLAEQPAFKDVYLAQQKIVKRELLVTQAFEIRGRF